MSPTALAAMLSTCLMALPPEYRNDSTEVLDLLAEREHRAVVGAAEKEAKRLERVWTKTRKRADRRAFLSAKSEYEGIKNSRPKPYPVSPQLTFEVGQVVLVKHQSVMVTEHVDASRFIAAVRTYPLKQGDKGAVDWDAVPTRTKVVLKGVSADPLTIRPGVNVGLVGAFWCEGTTEVDGTILPVMSPYGLEPGKLLWPD